MELLADWQKSRSPELADALDAQGVDKAWQRIEKLPASRAKTAVLNLSKTVDDPRLATLYVKWLAQGNWPAPTAKVVWERIFEHLVKLRDIRAIAPLRAVAANLPSFVGEAHRTWITEMIEQTITSLSAVKPTKGSGPRPDKRDAKPKVAPTAPAADPRAPIWNDPDDDELKQVVADALTERGDPQGEFITLQLLKTKSPAQRKRERELQKHQPTWLGAIGKLCVKHSMRFAAGFPVAVCTDRRLVPRREWEAALAAPQWATIERLCVSILHTPHWWITAWVSAPATQRVRAFEIGHVDYKTPALRIERAPGKPWRLTHTTRGYTSSGVPILRAFVAGLSKAERAAFTIAPTIKDRETYAAVLA